MMINQMTTLQMTPQMMELINTEPSHSVVFYAKVTAAGKVVTKGDKSQILAGWPEHVPIKQFVVCTVAAPVTNAVLGQNVDISRRSWLLVSFNHQEARLTEVSSQIGVQLEIEIVTLPTIDDKKKVAAISIDKYSGAEVQQVVHLGGQMTRIALLTFTSYLGEQPQKDQNNKDAGKATYGQNAKDLGQK